jgi:nicotinate-nucleotide adenylyltransferase
MALEQNNLDLVLWVLTPLSPLKKSTFSTLDQRIAMVESIVSLEKKFAFSRVDINREGPFYSVDTARLIRTEFEEEIELFFILGADSLSNLHKWYQHEELVFNALDGIIAARRPGVELDTDELEMKLPGMNQRVQFLDMPPLDCSSGKIREKRFQGIDIKGDVPDSVYQLIQKEKMYQFE